MTEHEEAVTASRLLEVESSSFVPNVTFQQDPLGSCKQSFMAVLLVHRLRGNESFGRRANICADMPA